MGSIPGSGRSPGVGNGIPLQCSCLEYSVGGQSWQAAVRGAAKSWTRLSDWAATHTHIVQYILVGYFIHDGLYLLNLCLYNGPCPFLLPSRPLVCSLYLCQLLFCYVHCVFFYISHINDIIQYLSFSVWHFT